MLIGIDSKNEIKQIGNITDESLHKVEISDTTLDTMSEYMLLKCRCIPQGEGAYTIEPTIDYETLMEMDSLNNENINLKCTTKQQDVLILEADLRIMDIEFMMEDLMGSPISEAKQLTARGSSYDLLLRMIEEGNYSSEEVMKNNIRKYYDRNRITEEEYLSLIEALESSLVRP